MVYFRVLPITINDIDDDFTDFFFKFANTYTEESILQGYMKENKEESVTSEIMAELGYSAKEIANMNLSK